MTVEELIKKLIPYSRIPFGRTNTPEHESYIIFDLRFDDGRYMIHSLPKEKRIGKGTVHISVYIGNTMFGFIKKLKEKKRELLEDQKEAKKACGGK